MTDLHPISAFATWYAAQPAEIKADIAGLILTCHPEDSTFDSLKIVADAEAVFHRWLDDLPKSPYRVVGRIFHIKSIMDFILIRRFGDPHDWEEKREMKRDMIADFRRQENHPLAEKLQQSLDDSPKHEQLWGEAARSWSQLCKSSLSTEVIETWLHETNLGKYGTK